MSESTPESHRGNDGTMHPSEVELSDSQKEQSVGPSESPNSLAVEASVEEYEMALRRELNLRQPESRAELKRRMQSFRDRILRSELADVGRDESQVAAEQKSIVDANFWVSLTVTAVVLVAAILAGDALVGIAEVVSEFITVYLSWFYLLITTGLLVFLLLLNFSRYGNVVLGSPDE